MRVLLTLLLLPACTALVPGMAGRLATLSPVTADPAEFAVRAELPDGLGLTPDGQWLTLSARSLTGASRSGRFPIRRAYTPDGAIWRIEPAVLGDLRRLQEEIREMKQTDPDGTTGSLGLQITGCTIGNGPDPRDRLTLFLRMERDGPFRPLLRNVRVSDVFETTDAPPLSPCP